MKYKTHSIIADHISFIVFYYLFIILNWYFHEYCSHTYNCQDKRQDQLEHDKGSLHYNKKLLNQSFWSLDSVLIHNLLHVSVLHEVLIFYNRLHQWFLTVTTFFTEQSWWLQSSIFLITKMVTFPLLCHRFSINYLKFYRFYMIKI